MARARPVQLFQADSDLLITTFCHYFSLNLTRKASIILLQRKTISNTSHTKQIERKSARACSKNKLFKVIALSRYFIGGREPIWYTGLAMRSADIYQQTKCIGPALVIGNGKTSVLALFSASKPPKSYHLKKIEFIWLPAYKKRYPNPNPNLKLNPNCNLSSNPNVNPNPK